MSNTTLTKPTLPSFNEIDRLVQKGRMERAIALRSAISNLTAGSQDATQPSLAGTARA